MNFALTARRILLTASVGLSLSGCIIIPTPEHGQLGPRDPIKRDFHKWLRESKPTREEVLFVLGGPETHTIDGQRCIYTWARIGGYWATGGGYSGAGGTIESRHFLVISFDENDRVESVEEPDRTLFSGFKSWNTDEGNLLKSPSELEESTGWSERDPAAGVDAIRFRSQAEWWANSDGPTWKNLMEGHSATRGHLTLTDSTIEFRMPSHWAEQDQQWAFTYAELADCYTKKIGRIPYVVIRLRSGESHAFTAMKPRWLGLFHSGKDNKSVLAFIQARIAEQSGTQAK